MLDREAALKLVTQNGYALEYASEDLKADRGVVRRALGSSSSVPLPRSSAEGQESPATPYCARWGVVRV